MHGRVAQQVGQTERGYNSSLCHMRQPGTMHIADEVVYCCMGQPSYVLDGSHDDAVGCAPGAL